MNSAGYDILLDMLSNLKVEYNDIKSQIIKNNNRISEIDNYIQSYLDEEDSNYKMFSPRDVESVRKNEFELLRIEKDNIQETNLHFLEKLDNIQSDMSQLQSVIDGEMDDDNKVGHFDPHYNVDSYAIIKIQEKERRRIARDLHDSSLQNLAYLIQKLELCGLFIDQDPIRAKMELSVISKNLHGVVDDIRDTIFNLRPMTFDDLGIKSAFERLLDKINQDKRYIIDVDIDEVSCENDLVLSTIYRVVQECLLNIDKHAEADRILFHCKCVNDYYHITIEDNGKGFIESEIDEKKNRHFGLSLLKERAGLLGGTVEIHSQADKGTRVNIVFPIKDILILD